MLTKLVAEKEIQQFNKEIIKAFNKEILKTMIILKICQLFHGINKIFFTLPLYNLTDYLLKKQQFNRNVCKAIYNFQEKHDLLNKDSHFLLNEKLPRTDINGVIAKQLLIICMPRIKLAIRQKDSDYIDIYIKDMKKPKESLGKDIFYFHEFRREMENIKKYIAENDEKALDNSYNNLNSFI